MPSGSTVAMPTGTKISFQSSSLSRLTYMMAPMPSARASLIASDGCAVKEPNPTQFRLPCTSMPSGV